MEKGCRLDCGRVPMKGGQHPGLSLGDIVQTKRLIGRCGKLEFISINARLQHLQHAGHHRTMPDRIRHSGEPSTTSNDAALGHRRR